MRIGQRFLLLFAFLLLIPVALAGYLAANANTAQLMNWRNRLFGEFTPNISGYFNASSSATGQQVSTAASKVSPATVSIFGMSQVQVSQPLYNINGWGFRWRRGFSNPAASSQTTATQVTAGSGFFVSADGYILTNKHVVADQSANYTVQLSDGRTLTASVVYRDPNQDLAIVKISGNNYPVLPLGDSSGLSAGSTIMDMGNALGRFPNSVSQGSVVDVNQTITVLDDNNQPQTLSGLVETTAPLYPGDSGGPTFDLQGRVVGVNVATDLQDGLSYSIPINLAKPTIRTALGQAG